MNIRGFDPNSYRPRNDTVVVKLEKGEETTESGLIIPKTVDDDYSTSEGTILSIGPGPRDEDGNFLPDVMEDLEVGDKVVFSKYAGRILDDTPTIKYMILSENEILAVKLTKTSN